MHDTNEGCEINAQDPMTLSDLSAALPYLLSVGPVIGIDLSNFDALKGLRLQKLDLTQC